MKHLFKLMALVIVALTFSLTAATANAGKSKHSKVKMRTANISWYGGHHHGRKTASGKSFNMRALTAAHKTLPFGTKVAMYNPDTQKRVVVTINDRGPYYGDRKFDVSRAAAKRLGILKIGHAKIKYRVLK